MWSTQVEFPSSHCILSEHLPSGIPSNNKNNRRSYMSIYVLLNSLNKLMRIDKMRGLPSILSLFCNKFNIFNNTVARMLDSMYRVTLRLLEVGKRAKIRNQYNQVPHLTQDTNGKVTNSHLDITHHKRDPRNLISGIKTS